MLLGYIVAIPLSITPEDFKRQRVPPTSNPSKLVHPQENKYDNCQDNGQPVSQFYGHKYSHVQILKADATLWSF